MRNSGIIILAAALVSGLGACSQGERAEAVQAEVTAQQMEAAKEGREAAKAIVTKNWTDTMQLQQAIIDARARNSKYEIEGDKAAKAAFDTAFINTIRTVRPDLADQLKP